MTASQPSPSSPTPAYSGSGLLWRTFWLNAIPVAVLAGLAFLGPIVENADRFDEYYRDILLRVGIAIILGVSLQLINGISGQFSLGHAGFMAVGAYLAGYATGTYARVVTADGDTLAFADPVATAAYFATLLGFAVLVGGALYVVVRACRSLGRLHGKLPTIVGLLLIGWVLIDLILTARGVQDSRLICGRGFAAVQALFVQTLANYAHPTLRPMLPAGVREPLTLLISMIGGGCVAALAGLLVGLPTLRLRGDYLAIATLGFAQIIAVLIVNSTALGGATGMSIPVYSVTPDEDLGLPARYVFPFVFGAAAVTTLLVWRLQHSLKGRAIQAVRDDEIAAAAVGIDATHYRVLAFVIGAFFAGVAGALHAAYLGYLNTNSYDFMASVELVVIVTLGGLGSIPGTIIAAVVLTVLPDALRMLSGWLPDSAPQWLRTATEWTRENRMVVYSFLLVLIMILRARGRGWLRSLFRRPNRSAAPATELTP